MINTNLSKNVLLKIENATPLFNEYAFKQPVNWEIEEGKHWALIGPNGSGKSLLINLLQGKVVLKEGKVTKSDSLDSHSIRLLQFCDIYSLTDVRNSYYQQRWNSADREESAPASELFNGLPSQEVNEYLHRFKISGINEKRLVSLSSGELRKALIIRTLIPKPHLLILNNPFIGLDNDSRESLRTLLKQLSEEEHLSIIFIVVDFFDIPPWVNNVLPIKEKTIFPAMPLVEFQSNRPFLQSLFPETVLQTVVLPEPISGSLTCRTVFDLKNVEIKYGTHVIFNPFNWQVNTGEKWALLGRNGSGKSTILSLLYADNPQAYTNQITLFNRKRGTGESIWEIKRHIGYLSADVHTYYLKDIPALDVVVSGFFDSIGLYKKGNAEQYALAKKWLETFHAAHLAARSFVRLSFGEQRLILLARAFVKDPAVLILDEPMHGLDAGKKHLAGLIIEAFCSRPEKTLIYVTHYEDEIPLCVRMIKRLL